MSGPDEPDPAPWEAPGVPVRELLNVSAGTAQSEPQQVQLRLRPPVPRPVQRHLMAHETSVVCVRHHWACAFWPMLWAVVATGVAAWVNMWFYWTVPGGMPGAALHVMWFLWLGVIGWAAYRVGAWRRWWFVITGVRIIDVRSWVRVHVEPMPLKRLADLRYDQSAWGRLIGYGTLHCASFATDHALHLIRFLPRSDMLEREISTLMYPPEQSVPLTARLLRAVDDEGELR
jgi:Bacterial PH domain